jgi:hypothetical protein
MRLRERVDRRLTKVYLDTLTLKQNALSLKDYKELVIQRTAVAEPELTPEHVLLLVRRWRPQTQRLERPSEVSMGPAPSSTYM